MCQCGQTSEFFFTLVSLIVYSSCHNCRLLCNLCPKFHHLRLYCLALIIDINFKLKLLKSSWAWLLILETDVVLIFCCNVAFVEIIDYTEADMLLVSNLVDVDEELLSHWFEAICDTRPNSCLISEDKCRALVKLPHFIGKLFTLFIFQGRIHSFFILFSWLRSLNNTLCLSQSYAVHRVDNYCFMIGC